MPSTRCEKAIWLIGTCENTEKAATRAGCVTVAYIKSTRSFHSGLSGANVRVYAWEILPLRGLTLEKGHHWEYEEFFLARDSFVTCKPQQRAVPSLQLPGCLISGIPNRVL